MAISKQKVGSLEEMLEGLGPEGLAQLTPVSRGGRRQQISGSSLWPGPRGWHFRDRVQGPDGKTTRPTVLLGEFTSRTEAEQEALRVRARRAVAVSQPGASPAWQAFCDWYIAKMVPQQRTESRRVSRSVVRNHISKRFAGARVHQVDKYAVQDWIHDMRIEGAPVSTIKHRVGILITMLHAGNEQLKLTVQVPTRLRYPKNQRVKRTHAERTYSAEEAARLIAAAEFPWKAAYGLALYAGLRPSEVAGMEWKYIDLKAALLTIAQQAQRGEVVLPKSNESISTKTMPAEMVDLLTQARARAAAHATFLFTNKAGKPIAAATMRRRLHRLCKRLGIRPKGMHAFRRRYADGLAEAHATLPVMQAAMRHASPTTTARYMSPANQTDVTDAIRRAAATHR